MGEIYYTGLYWRGRILLGTALRDGLVTAVADGGWGCGVGAPWPSASCSGGAFRSAVAAK